MSKTGQNLKDNFMGSMSGKIAAGALAFTTAFLPMTGKLGNTFDGIANAQDVKPVKHAPASVHVPMLDARTNGVAAVQVSGVALSSNREIVIIFYGQDRSLFNNAKEAAREAIADGLPVRGMVFGPPINQSSGIEIFANGLLVNRSDIKWDKEVISEAIKFANTEYIQSGRFDFAPQVTR